MFEPTELTATPAPAPAADLDRLTGVQVDVSVELGSTKMTLGEALAIGPGAVIPLGRTAGAPLDLHVNGQLVARGEVVVVDDVYGLRITEIAQQGTDAAAPAADGGAEFADPASEFAVAGEFAGAETAEPMTVDAEQLAA